MKGRPRKPTNLKVIDGNPGKRPLPKNEPNPVSPLPSPPSHLDQYALEEWNRLAEGLHNIGLLYEVDAAAFAGYCTSYSMWRHTTEKIREIMLVGDPDAITENKNLFRLSIDSCAAMIRIAAEFGLSPQARARLGDVAPTKSKSKFDGLLGGKK